MAKKTKQAAKTELRFAKGTFYADAGKRLWLCMNARTKTTPDGHRVVTMQPAKNGFPAGDPGEAYCDRFVKALTKAELAEYREACRLEAKGIAEAEAHAATKTVVAVDKPAKTATRHR